MSKKKFKKESALANSWYEGVLEEYIKHSTECFEGNFARYDFLDGVIEVAEQLRQNVAKKYDSDT